MAHEDELSFTQEEFGLTEVDTLIADARQGWEKAFQGMAMAGDDHLLDPEPMILTEWETRAWAWEQGLAEKFIE